MTDSKQKYYLALFYGLPTHTGNAPGQIGMAEITKETFKAYAEMERHGTLAELPGVRYVAEKAFGDDFSESHLLAGARTGEQMAAGAVLHRK